MKRITIVRIILEIVLLIWIWVVAPLPVALILTLIELRIEATDTVLERKNNF